MKNIIPNIPKIFLALAQKIISNGDPLHFICIGIDDGCPRSFSPLQPEFDPCDRQWLYVKGHDGRQLGFAGFLRVFWLPLTLMTPWR